MSNSKFNKKFFDLEAGCSDGSDDEPDDYSVHQSDLDFLASDDEVENDRYCSQSPTLSQLMTPVEMPMPISQRIRKGLIYREAERPLAQVCGLSSTPLTQPYEHTAMHELANAAAEQVPVPETDTDDKKRVRRFTMTLNNYTEAEIVYFKTLPDCRYKCFGKEVGKEGTKHLQAYLELDSSKKLSIAGLQKKISAHGGTPSRWAILVSKGSAAQNIKYCEKDGDFWEEGKRPAGQGKRTDLDDVSQLVIDSVPLKDIAMEHPKTFIMYSRGIQNLHAILNMTTRSEMTLGYWAYGKTATGKTRWAHSLSPGSTYSKDPMTKYFCGYSQEDTVILDDYRPNTEMSFSFLLRLADRYPINVQTKFGNVQFNSKRIIVTSPHCIEETFAHLDFLKEGQLAQLKRRFKEIEFGVGKCSHLLRLCDVNHPAVDEELTDKFDEIDGKDDDDVVLREIDHAVATCTTPLDYF